MQDTAGEAGTSSWVMYFYGPPHMTEQKQDGLLEHTYSSYVRIRDVALRTSQRRTTIGRSGERESRISVLVTWHGDVGCEGLIVIVKILFLNKQTNTCWFKHESRGFYDFTLRIIAVGQYYIYKKTNEKLFFPKMRLFHVAKNAR